MTVVLATNNKPKRTLVLVPFIVDISWRMRHPRIAHLLDKRSRWYCTDTEHVNVLARPDSDLAGDGFQKTHTHNISRTQGHNAAKQIASCLPGCSQPCVK